MRIRTTEECTELRPLQEEDAATVAAVTGDVSPERAQGWIRTILGYEEAGREVACGVWVDGKMAGYVLLEIHDKREGLLHYGLVPAYRGQGIATRACAAMVGYAFLTLGLQALKVDPLADNVESCRVAERLGFVKVGIVQIAEGGRPCDVVRYRLTAEQWGARQVQEET